MAGKRNRKSVSSASATLANFTPKNTSHRLRPKLVAVADIDAARADGGRR